MTLSEFSALPVGAELSFPMDGSTAIVAGRTETHLLIRWGPGSPVPIPIDPMFAVHFELIR
jgi:hypothetical protein